MKKTLGILIIAIAAINACKPKKVTEAVIVKPVEKDTVKPKMTVVNPINDSITHYNPEIKEIVSVFCLNCHYQKAYITDLSSYKVLKASADKGQLYHYLFEKKSMPPRGKPQPSPAQFEELRKWIRIGAPE
ncbi:MAG: hypothetical protein H7321_08970 [Bacteroidia bacterium]|nr:hypothetical protein [Bacteroidia bacterium]